VHKIAELTPNTTNSVTKKYSLVYLKSGLKNTVKIGILPFYNQNI